jgi:hypothetical protein
MPRPIFDKEQYELRGHLPEVYTEKQKEALNRVLSRVNGQLDWNAQLLGFNGDSYWGKRIPTTDGSYKWKGLPQTVSEKRAVQTGAFGVYNKDKPYLERPAPFQRSEVRASADFSFHVFVSEGKTQVTAFGQPNGLLFSENPQLVPGGEYLFDGLVDITTANGTESSLFVTQDLSQKITSLRLLDASPSAIFITAEGAQSPFIFFLREWEDISDWDSPLVLSQFLGVWGNKGNYISAHFLFDALDLHGFNEEEALSLDDIEKTFSVEELISSIGLVPAFTSSVTTHNFNFKVEDCDEVFSPTVSLETKFSQLESENLETILSETGQELVIDDGARYEEPDSEFGVCETPNYKLTLTQHFSESPNLVGLDPGPGVSSGIRCDGTPRPLGLSIDLAGGIGPELFTDPVSGEEINILVLDSSGLSQDEDILAFDGLNLESITFKYHPKTISAKVSFPCVEWIFDSKLDNSTYPSGPDYTVWAGTDDGEYDRQAKFSYDARQSRVDCISGQFDGPFLSFDDGEFDELFPPNCDLTTGLCSTIDGGTYLDGVNPLTPPSSSTNCAIECGNIDDGLYPDGLSGPSSIDGGEDDECITYDNTTYDFSGEVSCVLNNGDELSPAPTLGVDEKYYDRGENEITCEVCAESSVLSPCPTDPIRVGLDRIIFSGLVWRMRPSVSNSFSPLRIWKNSILQVPDPDLLEAYANPLIADENTGVVAPNEYRQYIRLPVDYSRNGKFWNRAESVASNQSYFSSLLPPSQTRLPRPDLLPILYDEGYSDISSLDSIRTFYAEDYLISTSNSSDDVQQDGFENAVLSYEPPNSSSPLVLSSVVDYDAYEKRKLGADGRRLGTYYKFKGGMTALSGYLEDDLAQGVLRPLERSQEHV